MDFLARIKQYIQKKDLLSRQGKYLVALSGGADSVALLWVLHDLGYTIEACHCNFHLRGEESNRDEAFCVHLCEQLGIALHRIHFDTRTYAEVHKESIELAARNLRYHYFHQLKDDLSADGICVAHHQDDSVETVLINLIRGTGIKGLTGISAKNGDILRPLLCVDRKEILEYIRDKGQDYVTDSTNLVDDVVRNKIRLNILPMLKEINPAVSQNIASTAHYLEEASKILQAATMECGDSKKGSCPMVKNPSYQTISKAKVCSAASPEFMLYSLLSPYGFMGKVIDDILESLSSTETVGKMWQSPTHELVIDRDNLVVREKFTPTFQGQRFPETGSYVLPPHLLDIDFAQSDLETEEAYQAFLANEQKLCISLTDKGDTFRPSKQHLHVTLDAQKVKFPLTLRYAENGDAFHPFGMKGNKLVSDYLTDRKKHLFQKQRQLVLLDATGKIIWLVGERTSDDSKVESSTSQVLEISIGCK